MSNPRGRSTGSAGPLWTAMIILAAALFLFSSTVTIRHWRGVRLVSLAMQSLESDSGKAEDLLKSALRLGSDDAAVELARLSYDRGDWNAFHEFADSALELNPGRGYVYMLRAYALAAERPPEDPAGAERIVGECRSAVAVDPANGNLWRRYAELAFSVSRSLAGSAGVEVAAGYRQESIVAYGRALRLDSHDSMEALENLIDNGGDSPFMVDAFRHSPPAVLRRVAANLLDRGEWEMLRERFLRGASESDGRRNAYWAAAEELRSRKLNAEVLDLLRDYPFASQKDAHLAFLAGRSAESLGPESDAWSAAEKHYRVALRLDGEKVWYRIHLGAVLNRDGRHGEAENELRQATASAPENAWAWYHLGQALKGVEREDEALASYRRAVELKPDNEHLRKVLEKMEERISGPGSY